MFAQTLFYFVISASIIVCAVLLAVVAIHLIHIVKKLEQISRNLHDASDEAKQRMREVMDRLSEVPFLSFFMKRRGSREKGRE